MSVTAPRCIACIPTRAISRLARQGIISTSISRTISTDNAQADSRLALYHPQIIQHQLTYRFLLNHDTNALTPILPNAVKLVRIKQLDAHGRAHESAPALVQIGAALSRSQQRARPDPTHTDTIWCGHTRGAPPRLFPHAASRRRRRRRRTQPRPPEHDSLHGGKPPQLVARPHAVERIAVLDRIDARRAPSLHTLCAPLPPLRRVARARRATAVASPSIQGDIEFVCGCRRSCSRGGRCGCSVGRWCECCGADEGCGGGAETIERCAGTARAAWHGVG